MKSKSILYTVLLSVFLLFLSQQAFSQQHSPELSQKLEALEAAREAGILTHDEFKQKEQILRKRYSKPQLSVSQQKKLQALEAAKKAGIITHQEYLQKKSAIAPGSVPPIKPSAASTQVQAPDQAPKVSAEYTPPSKKARKTFMHPIGFTFVYPADWVAQNPAQHDFADSSESKKISLRAG